MFKRTKKGLINRLFRCMEIYDITMEELKRKQCDGALVIDVRSTQEYNEGHIIGSLNIPEYEINCNIDEILKNKNDTIILYCTSGKRSKKAYKKLNALGYKNIYNLYGGLDNW